MAKKKRRRRTQSSELLDLSADLRGITRDLVDVSVSLAVLNTVSGVARQIRKGS